MKVKWIVWPEGSGSYHWWSTEVRGNSGQGLLAQLSAAVGQQPVGVIWPAPQGAMHAVGFDKSERKHLRKTLPFTLEESLISDVDRLHFAFSVPDEGEAIVAVVEREPLDQLLETLRQEGITVGSLWPEQLLVPWREKRWTLWLEPDYCVVRYAEAGGFGIELENLPLALEKLREELEHPPEGVDFYCSEDSRDELVRALPQYLQSETDWKSERVYDLGEGSSCSVDLLQGDYGHRLPWGELSRFWRWPAVLLLFLITLNFAYLLIENYQLQQRNMQLVRETEQAFRSAIPAGVIAEPVLQLRRLVKRGKSGAASNVLGFIYRFGEVLNNDSSGLELKSASYNELQDEFQIYIVAKAFTDVESFRESLQNSGLQASLIGTSSENDKTLARLRIRRPL